MATSAPGSQVPMHGGSDIEMGHQSQYDTTAETDADVANPSGTTTGTTAQRLQLQITDLLLDSKTLVCRLELFEGQEEDPKPKLDQLVEQPPRSIRIWDYSRGCSDCVQQVERREKAWRTLCSPCERLDALCRSTRPSSGDINMYLDRHSIDMFDTLTAGPLTKAPLFDLHALLWPPVLSMNDGVEHASIYLPGLERPTMSVWEKRDPLDCLTVDYECLSEGRLRGKK